jgi:Ni,Fe-hydrogenase I cytochrome b subunit
MIYTIMIFALGIVGFAIYKKKYVRASFNFFRINFSIETDDGEPKKPVLPSS